MKNAKAWKRPERVPYLLSPILSLFPFLPIPYPFRRLPFSSFRQNIKNSMIDGYITVINSLSFMIKLSLTTIKLMK